MREWLLRYPTGCVTSPEPFEHPLAVRQHQGRLQSRDRAKQEEEDGEGRNARGQGVLPSAVRPAGRGDRNPSVGRIGSNLSGFLGGAGLLRTGHAQGRRSRNPAGRQVPLFLVAGIDWFTSFHWEGF